MHDLLVAIEYGPAGFALVTLLGFMTTMWVIAYSLKRLDLVDVAWGIGFIIIALLSYAWAVSYIDWTPRFIVCLLVIIWATRLTIHLARRFFRRKEEDIRYQDLRKGWKGSAAINSYVKVFLLQAVLIYIIAFPVQIISMYDLPADGWLLLGVVAWLIGFTFEAIGDKQLADFSKDRGNKGKLLTSGLWKYTRHPNYFGEAVQWWGIYMIGVPIILINPVAAWALLPGPILLTVLVLFISGVPITEKLMMKRKGWNAYAARTSKFLPLPPKKS